MYIVNIVSQTFLNQTLLMLVSYTIHYMKYIHIKYSVNHKLKPPTSTLAGGWLCVFKPSATRTPQA